MRGATLFSGGRGAEALLTDMIDFVFSVEYDPKIAEVGAQLGGHTFINKVEDVDYSTWGRLDYLHASPVCKEYSAAKSKGVEGDADLSSAAAVVRCLEATQPRLFTLENVGAYQHGQAYRRIVQWLNHNGYMWHAEVLNSADFGVPQTRRRLILRAVRDALLPTLPPPVPWVGWYEAIEDLIPTLPESQFAPWQLSRLAAAFDKGQELSQNFFVGGANKSQSFLDFAVENRPTIPGIRNEHEPIMLVPADAATNHAGRAFIVSNAATMDMRDAGEPMVTVTATTHSKAAMPRAFLVESRNTTGAGNIMAYTEETPAMTVPATATKGMPRAWLVESRNSGQQYGDGRRRDDEPATTVVTDARPSHMPKGWLSCGRVVRMTPRALARFQSFPDSYVLPERAALACTVIGNAVPSLMMRRIVEQLI